MTCPFLLLAFFALAPPVEKPRAQAALTSTIAASSVEVDTLSYNNPPQLDLPLLTILSLLGWTRCEGIVCTATGSAPSLVVEQPRPQFRDSAHGGDCSIGPPEQGGATREPTKSDTLTAPLAIVVGGRKFTTTYSFVDCHLDGFHVDISPVVALANQVVASVPDRRRFYVVRPPTPHNDSVTVLLALPEDIRTWSSAGLVRLAP